MIYSVWFLEGIISEVVGCVLFLYFYLFLSLFQIISHGFLVKFFLLCLRCHSKQCQMFIIPYIHNFVPFIYIIYYHFVCCILEDWCWFHILDCVVILFGFFLFLSFIVRKNQGLIQAVFDIGIPILGTLIWVCPNSIIGKVKTTKKCKTRFNLLGHVIDIS